MSEGTPSAAPSRSAGDLAFEESMERGQKALNAARQALEPSPEEVAQKARNDDFRKELHEVTMGILAKQERALGSTPGSTPEQLQKVVLLTDLGKPAKPAASDSEIRQIQLTDRELKIWSVIQRGVRGPQYCRELDSARIAPLRSGIWKDCPRKYASAYREGNPWRHRIQDEKSKVRRKAELAGVAKLASE
jgi:hypothetical protein